MTCRRIGCEDAGVDLDGQLCRFHNHELIRRRRWVCRTEGCGGWHHAGGLCAKHYEQRRGAQQQGALPAGPLCDLVHRRRLRGDWAAQHLDLSHVSHRVGLVAGENACDVLGVHPLQVWGWAYYEAAGVDLEAA